MFTVEFFLIQAVGLVGLAFVVLSFQKDNRSFVLSMHLSSALAFVIHFLFLGAVTGAAIQLVSAGRALIFNSREKYKWLDTRAIMVAFIAIFWIVGFVTWQGYVSIFPVLAMTLESFALWSRNTTNVRWLFLSARPGWILYHAFVGSYAGLATEAFIVTSLIIAMIRFDKEKLAGVFSKDS